MDTGNIQQNQKSGGDAQITAEGQGYSTAGADTVATGDGFGGMADFAGLSEGTGTGDGTSLAGSDAVGASAGAAGGDVSDQTSIGSINIQS